MCVHLARCDLVLCLLYISLCIYLCFFFFFFFKQKTAYEMRISDWSSDVCSSDLRLHPAAGRRVFHLDAAAGRAVLLGHAFGGNLEARRSRLDDDRISPFRGGRGRSEEHTSELQSLMRISYAVFCLKKKKQHIERKTEIQQHDSTRTSEQGKE